MTTETRPRLHTGGCQCGAVRYALLAEPYGAHICHCRMCQKAFGGPFAPLAIIDLGDFEWTRGRPATFASSATVERGFCTDCGTPLTYRETTADRIDISLGSLDQPARVRPATQIGIEGRLSWFADLAGLPEKMTEAAIGADRLARIESRQHPDHDT